MIVSLAGRAALAANPSILFCSPQGASYGWVDLTYLSELKAQGFEVDYTESLKDVTSERVQKYNVLVVFSSAKTPEFTNVVEKFLTSGGGVLLMAPEYNIGKQQVVDLTERWGAKIPVERIVEKDKEKLATFDHMTYPAAFTDQILPSPVSEGVKGIWYPYQPAYNAQQTCPIWVNEDWQVVVTASPTTVTEPVDLAHSASGPVENPFIREGGVKSPPLFAIRTYPNGGAGRIAFLSQWQQFSVGQGTKWVYDRQILTRGFNGKPSDFARLLENTYRWLAAPSLQSGAPGGFTTVAEKLIPPNKRPEAKKGYEDIFWEKEPEELGYGRPPKEAKIYRGLIGIKSAYSTGQGSVAEYAAAAQQVGLDFIVFMEDFSRLTPDKLKALKADCAKNSNDKVKLFAGYTIDNNIGNHLFFYGPDLPWIPERCLTGPNNSLLNQQNQDKDGKFLNKQGPVLDWLLTDTHVEHAQVGFYNFAGSGRGMRIPDLRTYGMAAVRYYEHGKLIEDVTQDYLTTAQGTIPPAPASVNLVTSPAELVKEANSGHSLVYAQSRSLANLFVEALRWTHQYDGVNVFTSDGPQIVAWPSCYRVGTFGSEEFVTGRILMPSLIHVTSDKGLKEITIYNGQNLFRRFKFKGEKDFQKTLMLEGAVQKNLVLIAEDVAGGKAVSFARRCWKDGAREVVFCSDHVNDCKSYGMILGHGPTAVPFTRPPELPNDIAGDTWDGGPAGILPLVMFQGTPPVLTTEQGVEDGDRFNQTPLLEFSDEGAVAAASYRSEVFDDVVPSGEVMNPWHGYGPKGPSRFTEHTLRFREWIPPTVGVPETGWAGPGVRVGTNACLFRGEMTFKQDLKIKSLLLVRNWQPPRVTPALFVVGTKAGVKEMDLAQMQQQDFLLETGDWFGLYSPKVSNRHLFVNRGGPIRVNAGPGGILLSAPLEGREVKKGESYTYEVVSIGFPVDVEVKSAQDLARTLSYIKEPTGMLVVRGKRGDSPGVLEFDPVDGAIEISIPKPSDLEKFTLPMRVRNLNPRWSAGLFQKSGYVKGEYGTGENRYRPLGLDLAGNAYIPLYVSWADKTHIVAGHPVVAGLEGKDLFIQVTHVNDNPQKWHVSVNNPTDKAITTTLKKVMDLPGLDFQSQKITVPPGGYLVLTESAKPA